MAKKKVANALPHEHNRGTINGCAMAALVTSPMFKSKTFKAKKGKGSFSRKGKGKGMEPYQSALKVFSVKALYQSPSYA